MPNPSGAREFGDGESCLFGGRGEARKGVIQVLHLLNRESEGNIPIKRTYEKTEKGGEKKRLKEKILPKKVGLRGGKPGNSDKWPSYTSEGSNSRDGRKGNGCFAFR